MQFGAWAVDRDLLRFLLIQRNVVWFMTLTEDFFFWKVVACYTFSLNLCTNTLRNIQLVPHLFTCRHRRTSNSINFELSSNLIDLPKLSYNLLNTIGKLFWEKFFILSYSNKFQLLNFCGKKPQSFHPFLFSSL